MQNTQEAKNKRGRPKPIKTKQDWHERLRNIRIGKKGADDSSTPDNSTMAYAIFDENLYLMNVRGVPQSNVSLFQNIYFVNIWKLSIMQKNVCYLFVLRQRDFIFVCLVPTSVGVY